MGGEAVTARYLEDNEDIDRELYDLQRTMVHQMTPSQIKRSFVLADHIIDESFDHVVFRQRLETAYLVASIGEMRIPIMDDSQKLLIVQKLTELAFDDEREIDSTELPIVLEVLVAQELISLSIGEEVVNDMNIQEEILGPIQELITTLSERADRMFDHASGNISYTDMVTDDGDDVDVYDDLDGLF